MYRIDHAREICAQIGLRDAIMINKQPENRVHVGICVVGGDLFGGVMTACGPLQVRGKPSDKPERRGGLLGVIAQRWNAKKASWAAFTWIFALWAGVCPRFGGFVTARGPL